MSHPRLRMFAGPNGSGKSTLKSILSNRLLGVYINPDEIEKNLRGQTWFDLSSFGIATDRQALSEFFSASELLKKANLLNVLSKLKVKNNQVCFETFEINSYLASVLADFIRHQLLKNGLSFTFETVMSSADKIVFLRKAQDCGYRTYLYYVATEDPAINLSRIAHRVKMGGHPVPENKIFDRYSRSLDLLMDAIAVSNRAYLFDNSGEQQIWIAEITNGYELEMKASYAPHWFKTAVLDKVTGQV